MKKSIEIYHAGQIIVGQLSLPDDEDGPLPAVILCHGIPSGITDPDDPGYPLLAETICKESFAVLTFNFRGTGDSGGNFSISGWARDLEAIIDYLWNLTEADNNHLILVGFSAGAAISIYIAAQDKRVSAIAACACPSDFSAITQADDPQQVINYFRKLGILRDPGYPPSTADWLNEFHKIEPIRQVVSVAPRPLLLIHSRYDQVVPLAHGQKLYARAGDPKSIVIIDGDEHRLRRNQKAVESLIAWLKAQVGGN